jgi:hypothetical protein
MLSMHTHTHTHTQIISALKTGKFTAGETIHLHFGVIAETYGELCGLDKWASDLPDSHQADLLIHVLFLTIHLNISI